MKMRNLRATLAIICLLLTAIFLPGCTAASGSDHAVISDSLRETLATFNRGAALLEQYRYTKAATEFEKVLEVAPHWTAARFNLGLAYLNLADEPGEKNHVELARQAFETVLRSKPDHLHAQFCLGLYYQYLGNNEEAQKNFRKVYQADDKDHYVMYKLAEVLISLGRTQEGTALLENIVQQDPGFVSAIYRLATQYQRTRQRKKAKPLFKRFKKLNDAELAAGSFTVQQSYGAAGKYYVALGADDLPIKTVETKVPKRIVFSPQPKYLDTRIDSWKYPGGTVELSGIAVGDVDGDRDLDICITGFGSDGKLRLYRNDGTGVFSEHTDLADNAISPCFGDVDDDGDLDLWIGRAGTDLYFTNDGKGNFHLEDSSLFADNGNATQCARLVDIDSDGDLDFLALQFAQGSIPFRGQFIPSTSSFHNNNRDGSFTDIAEKLGLNFPDTTIAATIYDDFDNDRDLDMLLFPAGDQAPICWVNDRLWEYHILDAETSGLSVTRVLSATSGDPDKDGDRDLLLFTTKGTYLFINDGRFHFTQHQGFKRTFARLRASAGQFADMDNDGDLDIVIADAFRQDRTRGPTILVNDWPRDRFIDILQIDPGNVLAAITTKKDATCVVADFTGNGKCDLLLAEMGQKPFLLENVTPSGNWIEIDLLGTRTQDKKSRSNNSAIGARVDIKAGNISQQYVIGVPSGPLALAPYRIHAGLGDHRKVDWLRIMWPDGVLQAELELDANQIVSITEIQRKTSSCPHLFAWDGSHFEFVSDFGGMGGVGYLLGQAGQYAKPDPTEYLTVPNLKAKNGEYVLQVLEPLEEVVFFDEAKLIAVDHPQGTQVYPHEMMAINIPPPPFELFCFAGTIEAVRATDHHGRDVTEEIRRIDRTYAGTTELDIRFTGFAKDHFVELDFGDRLDSQITDQRLVLFLYGWVEYGYSTTNFAAAQANMTLKAPTIEVYRDGAWTVLFTEVGYPAGLQHMMTLDVTGKVLPGDRYFRISTNMEIYWDRIFMAPVLDQTILSVKEVPVDSADLHFLGFLREFSPDGRHPKLYDYDSVDRAVPWKMLKGNYTRFGDVTELLDAPDDCYVIMGRGEELTLRFSVDDFGPVPQGHTRTFILKTDSFCKDMDFCSAYPDTVNPLPFHGMSNYPYSPPEKYPDDQKRRSYRSRFNTRRIGGLED